jgi:phenylpropionate dioxygenase-like ring-hydroxylating dioxygenase large terminal subunit
MRRYWQPVCTSDELRDLPRKEKLLCEEIVVFRDKKGRVGALDLHCAHRGTSLEWGRVEEAGLRCCYHGWLYDTEGQCIDNAVRDRGVPPGDGCVAARLSGDGIWRARLCLYGPARHRAVVPALRHHRPGLE